MRTFNSKKFIIFWPNFIMLLALFFYPLKILAAAQNLKLAEQPSEKKQNEVLVKLKSKKNILKIKINSGQKIEEVIKNYQTNPSVEYAEPNFLYRASIIPIDPFYSEQQNYLKQIDLPRAWDETTGRQEIVVALLDSGVDIDHEDLKDNIWTNTREIAGDKIDNDKNGYVDDIHGWDFISNTPDPRPKFEIGCLEKGTCSKSGVNHGTIMAGIIAARGNNAKGIVGASWYSKIMPLRVLDSDGVGDTLTVSKAIDYAVANGAQIINLSFVGFDYSQTMGEAIRRAYEKGVIVVAAAGNENNPTAVTNLDKNKLYPICYAGPQGENWVIGVTSVDYKKQKAFFSNYGHDCIDVSAPGTGFYSTLVYNTTDKDFVYPYGGYWSGTSVSTALVSGVIALAKSRAPRLSNAELLKYLFNNTDEVDSANPDFLGQLGRGMINAGRTLAAIAGQEGAPLSSNFARLVVSPMSASAPEVNLIEPDKKLIRYQFLAYNDSFRGGVNLAVGDVDGDGEDEIITGAGKGGGPHIKIFNRQGVLKKQFYAFDKNFLGGVRVGVVDLNNDGIKEIIAAPESGGGPQVRVFDGNGNLRLQFFALDKSFRGGLSIAGGDIDKDGEEEIIVGAGPGTYPYIRIFDKNGRLKEQFFAYDKSFRGGVNVAVGDLKNNSFNFIVAAPRSLGGQEVKIFDQLGREAGKFFAFSQTFGGATNIALGDVDNDGQQEIVVAAGTGGAPHVRIFDSEGKLKNQFYVYSRDFHGGINVAAIR